MTKPDLKYEWKVGKKNICFLWIDLFCAHHYKIMDVFEIWCMHDVYMHGYGAVHVNNVHSIQNLVSGEVV